MAVVKQNLVEQWVINNSANIWANVWNYSPLEWVKNYIVDTGTKQQKKKENELLTQKYIDARKTDQTIWWYNYYLPNNQNSWPEWTSSQVTQWSKNALVNSWAVAGIPQWPNYNIDLNQLWTAEPIPQQAEQTTAPVDQTPKTTKWATKGTGVSTPNNNIEEPQTREPYADIVNWTWPIGKQKEQPAENGNEQALIDLQNSLVTEQWKIYWKFSENVWDPNNWINTLDDPYSVEARTNQARVTNLRSLQSMSSESIATSIVNWTTPYWDQAMRDLQQYNPTKYAEVQQFIKEQKWQENVDSIMTDWTIKAVSQVDKATDNVNNDITDWAERVSSNPEESSQVTTNLMSTMSSNMTANSSVAEMRSLKAQIADYEEKIANIQVEAQNAFKWDVPQYIVDAYASNRLQKYQSEINKLESRYTAELDLYKTELANAQWQEEMKLKYLQFQEQQTNNARDRYYQSQVLLQNNIKRVDGKAYMVDPATWWYTQLTDTTAYDTYNQAVNSAIQWYTSMFYDWYECWLQCEWFTDNFTQATTWVRMTWENGRQYTTAEEKLSYVNDLTPRVWSVVVAVGGAYDSTYWHTMLITWYDPESWIMDLMWSNTNWDRTIHTSRTTMADIQRNSTVAWIWNPYITAQSQSMTPTSWVTQYGVTITPMTNIFDEMIAKWKDTDTIAKAEQSYTYLYEMVNDWSLQQLIDSGDMAKIMAYMSKWKYWEIDDEWAKFSNRLKTYAEKYAAKELTWWDKSLQALNRLMQLVEVKLRKESWAAINSSERLTNFEMFLPTAWDTNDTMRDKMKTRDSLILRNLRSAWLPSVSLYVPIFWTQARQIRSY